MDDHLLTFELESDRLVVHANRSGLRLLAERLLRLAESTPEGEHEHEHLMTPEWGGSELTSAQQGEGEVVHHVMVFCWGQADAPARNREA